MPICSSPYLWLVSNMRILPNLTLPISYLLSYTAMFLFTWLCQGAVTIFVSMKMGLTPLSRYTLMDVSHLNFFEREGAMNRIFFPCRAMIFAIIGLAVLSALANGQPDDQSVQQNIEQILSQKDTFQISGGNLNTWIVQLRDKYGLNIVIDSLALQEKQIAEDAPVTLKLKDVSVRSALDLALRPLGLTWTVYSEAVVVTTPIGLRGMQYAKAYDITALSTVVDEQGKISQDPEALVQLITSAVSPDTWDGTGGSGTIQLVSAGSASLLVVWQDYRVQRQIVRLLTDMQNIAKQHAAAEREKNKPAQ
jgi:hypothetical protein